MECCRSSIERENPLTDFYLVPQYQRSFSSLLDEYRTLICSSNKAGPLDCYDCRLQYKKYEYYFEFGRENEGVKDCSLKAYGVLLKSEDSEDFIKEFLVKMHYQPTLTNEKKLAVPTVYEFHQGQMNISRGLDGALDFRFSTAHFVPQVLEVDKTPQLFLAYNKELWKRYYSTTRNYLKEIDDIFKKDFIGELQPVHVTTAEEWQKTFEDLQIKIKASKSQEEKSCWIYNYKNIYSAPLNKDIYYDTFQKEKLEITFQDASEIPLKMEEKLKLGSTVCTNVLEFEKIQKIADQTNDCTTEFFESLEKNYKRLAAKNLTATEKMLLNFYQGATYESQHYQVWLDSKKKTASLQSSLKIFREKALKNYAELKELDPPFSMFYDWKVKDLSSDNVTPPVVFSCKF